MYAQWEPYLSGLMVSFYSIKSYALGAKHVLRLARLGRLNTIQKRILYEHVTFASNELIAA